MAIFVIICIFIVSLFIIVLIIKYRLFRKYFLNNFKTRNCIVYGPKGNGKDCVFQYVINARDDFYYGNIDYGGEREIITLKDVSCEPNTYLNFINNKLEQTEHKFYENKDIYISDVGNFLPSYMDATLYKLFPSMPIFYSLDRHLYNSNVHVNCQNLTRCWKALREQGDFFVRCCGVIKLPFFLVINVRCYERYETALENKLPIKSRFLNKYSKAQVDLYNASNGVIKTGLLLLRKKKIKYDTRAFEKLLLKGERKEYVEC